MVCTKILRRHGSKPGKTPIVNIDDPDLPDPGELLGGSPLDFARIPLSRKCLEKHGQPSSWKFLRRLSLSMDGEVMELRDLHLDAHGAEFELQYLLTDLGIPTAAALDCEPRLSVADASQVPTSCVQCGVCCFSRHPRYVYVGDSDLTRMSEASRAFTHVIEVEPYELVPQGGQARYMRFENGRCTALHLDPDTGSFRCTIYEERPTICREFEEGGESCRKHRVAKFRLPLIAMDRQKHGA